MLFETADAVKAAGATILRGGAFKPRTSPYAFQGLGVEGLRYLAEARERTGLPVDHRGDGAVAGRHRRRVRRHPPDRHPQHAELLAAAGDGSRRPAGDAQARLRRDRRGMDDGGRVHRQLGQPERDPVRARHPDVRDVHAQHDGPGRGAAGPPPDPPAGHRRSEPRHREALARQAPGARRRRGRGRRRHGRGPSRPRTRRCPTPSSSSPSTSSAT